LISFSTTSGIVATRFSPAIVSFGTPIICGIAFLVINLARESDNGAISVKRWRAALPGYIWTCKRADYTKRSTAPSNERTVSPI
jgi:hypothetical protein